MVHNQMPNLSTSSFVIHNGAPRGRRSHRDPSNSPAPVALLPGDAGEETGGHAINQGAPGMGREIL